MSNARNIADITNGDDAPVYACRAWVNFDGTNAFSPNPSTSAIRDFGNVSSIYENGTGDYTVNFATAMPDANYSAIGMSTDQAYGSLTFIEGTGASYTASSFRVQVRANNSTTPGLGDPAIVSVAIFR